MFRELLRVKQKMSTEDCIELLNKETRGVLSVSGDEGYPYGIPMNHWYNVEDGCLYFHCGKIGHKLDAIKRNDKVSFCVHDNGLKEDGEWAYTVKSTVIFGRMKIIDEISIVKEVAEKLSYKFTEDRDYIINEINTSAENTLVLKLIPESICGKIVKEA